MNINLGRGRQNYITPPGAPKLPWPLQPITSHHATVSTTNNFFYCLLLSFCANKLCYKHKPPNLSLDVRIKLFLYKKYNQIKLLHFYISIIQVGRKPAILSTLLVAGCCSLGVAAVPADDPSLKTVRMIIGVVGKCMATGALEGLYVWTAEIYPTAVRSKGTGFAQVISH